MKLKSLWVASAIFLVGSQSFSKELIDGDILSNFKPVTAWLRVRSCEVVDGKKGFSSIADDAGAILLNGDVRDRKIPYLFTVGEYGDVSVSVEFMLPKGSNAGIYFMGRYEVQIFDSHGKEEVNHSDLGGIYQRWDDSRPKGKQGYEGVAPKVNAAKAPGEWQRIDVVFRAPRFDAVGNKTENARFISVKVNGRLVQENTEVTGPTRSAQFADEAAIGPVVIQGDHGPIAIRSFTIVPKSK